MKKKKRVFSGIQPTGNIHIGNYLGAIQGWVQRQTESDNIFCIVDLHAITVYQNPEVLKEKIREVASILFAAGIDPKLSMLFVQSHISAHCELTWILNCLTPIGWMQRMTQFKEKSKKQKEKVNMGLFDYPALMAADILLYNTDIVPVGEDQKQHVELTRDIAQRFNSLYGETFNMPRAVMPKSGARIMALDNPTQKMSKSEKRKNNAINLLDSPDVIRSKIMRAITDSKREIIFDEKRPGIFNLLVIYELFSEFSRKKIEEKFKGKGYVDFKRELAEVVIEGLRPLQFRYKELKSNPDYIDSLLKDGASRIRPIAQETLRKVKDKLGLG